VIRVLVADDQRVVREGLVLLLGLIDDLEVVGAAADGAEAVELAVHNEADVVLMDLRMPNTDGVAATRQLAAERPQAKVLILTTYADDASVFPALQAGARGYLTKDTGADALAAAIRAVHAGGVHLDPAVQARLLTAAAGTPPPDELTPREAEVLALIAEGLSNAEIAERLVVSLATVKTHVNRIFAKTGVRDRAQAVRYAYREGLATPPSA
jgi:DNA-binding NarL/FixJ family response regulator